MVASQLLLLAFVAYWLHSEYGNEKIRLRKDLTAELQHAQEEISDSIIVERYLQPVIAELDSSFTVLDSSLKAFRATGKNVRITNIRIGKTTSFTDGIERETTLEIDSQNTDTRFPIHEGQEENFSIDSSTARKLMTEIFSVVAKELVKDSLKKTMQVNMPDDSTRTKKRFEYILSSKGWNFNTTWHGDTVYASRYMTINAKDHTDVKISGYSIYLLKKITPQVLFSLLLLVLTGFAFWLTYQSLRKQIKLSELKNGLISNMSHELKTPVSTVKVALEALDDFDVVNQPEKAREYIHMAMLETHRLELLINKALNTSLMEQGKMTLSRQPVDVLSVMTEIVAALHLRLQQKGAQINLSSTGENFVINADKLHLQGAAMNIIDNSLKYGNKNIVIDINVIAKDASVIIELSDNGPGIPQKYAGQVFDKFFRVPEGDRHNVKGYGLGLSYVQQVMQMHDGYASLKNPSGAGCTFRLQFYKGR